MNCKCGTQGLVDTPWAACLVAEEDQCPNNFIKVDDDGTCAANSRRIPAWKPRVCCLMTPLLEFKVNIPSYCLTPKALNTANISVILLCREEANQT